MVNTNKKTSNKQNSSSINDAFASVSLFDKLWLLLKNHSKQITIISITGLALVAIVAAYLLRTSTIEKKIAKDFQKLQTIESKIDFIKEYSGKTLAGTVALELADTYFKLGNVLEAAKFYKTALKSELPAGLNIRSEIYLACCLYKTGKPDIAKFSLQSIIDNIQISSSNRALAEFVLINMMIEQQETKTAIKLAKLASEKDYDQIWSNLFLKIANQE